MGNHAEVHTRPFRVCGGPLRFGQIPQRVRPNGISTERFIRGAYGDDDFYQGVGDDIIDGAGGDDTVHYGQDFFEYKKIVRVGNTLLVTGPEGSDHLRDVEKLQFNDVLVDISDLLDELPLRCEIVVYDGSDDTALFGSEDLLVVTPGVTVAAAAMAVQAEGAVPLLRLSDFDISEAQVGGRSFWEIVRDFFVATAHADGSFTLANDARSVTFQGAQSIALQGHGAETVDNILNGVIPDDHGDDGSDATVFSLGPINEFTTVPGTREHGSDQDVYEVTLAAGQEVSILLWANSTKNSQLDPFLTVRFPDGTTRTSNNLSEGSLTSMVIFEAPSSGTYTITASGVGTTTGDYWLSVTPLNTDDTAAGLGRNRQPRHG